MRYNWNDHCFLFYFYSATLFLYSSTQSHFWPFILLGPLFCSSFAMHQVHSRSGVWFSDQFTRFFSTTKTSSGFNWLLNSADEASKQITLHKLERCVLLARDWFEPIRAFHVKRSESINLIKHTVFLCWCDFLFVLLFVVYLCHY